MAIVMEASLGLGHRLGVFILNRFTILQNDDGLFSN